jgi:splicing factor 3B subunit 3
VVRGPYSDAHDAYIVVAFVNATVVLSIGESVEEVTDTGMHLAVQTLAMAQLGDDALVQVHWRSRASQADKESVSE